MIDNKLNKFLKPTLNEIAKLLIKFGFKANFVTFAGFFFGLCCFYFIIKSLFLLAIIFLFLNRLFDGLDGAIARLNGKTDIGAFYDIILDFIFYSLFPIAFIFLDLNYSYSICFLLLSFVATQTTFLASAWIWYTAAAPTPIFWYSGKIPNVLHIIVLSLFSTYLQNPIRLPLK